MTLRRFISTMALLPFGLAVFTESPAESAAVCPPEMARVTMASGGKEHAFCIDRWEAHVVEIEGKQTKPHSPYQPVTNKTVRAVSKRGVVPQAYLSRDEAESACKAAKKRLCKEDEWVTACQGKTPTTFPYGNDRVDGYCNDTGKAPLGVFYASMGQDVFGSFSAMNDARLNQVPGSLAKTGSYPHCRNAFGVFDMVGNLHEWVEDPNGTFRGGYYLDTKKNGDGCKYRTDAHDRAYHDYSTGFRCCKDSK